MAKPRLFTLYDAIEHLLDDADGGRSFEEMRRVRRAIDDAYRQLPGERDWLCLRRAASIVTVAPQTTGTVTYDHTGGTNERQLTLSGATWPSWAIEGAVIIGARRYELAEVISSTVVTLSPTSNPGADITTATTYTLCKDFYSLPTDFGAMGSLVDLTSGTSPEYVSDSAWLSYRILDQSPSRPEVYTILGSPDYQGQKAIAFSPAPDSQRFYDFVYRRHPRPLWVENYHKGTVTATLDSAVITGTATAWTRDLEGTVIRFSDNDANPDSAWGEKPFEIERVVISINVSTQQATLDAAMPKALTAVKYRMSDQIDLELNVMLNPFLRLCEAQNGVLRVWKSGDDEKTRQERRAERRLRLQEYREALDLAASMDNPSYEVTSPLEGGGGIMRLSDMHSGGIGDA